MKGHPENVLIPGFTAILPGIDKVTIVVVGIHQEIMVGLSDISRLFLLTAI